MSNTAGEQGALNSFGDLSRRARRELEESGVNPEAARDALLSTGAITLPTGSILTTGLVNPATGGMPATPSTDTGQHDTSGLSRRELRAMQERTDVSPGAAPTFSLPTTPGVPGYVAPATSTAFDISPALADTATPVEQVISQTTTPLDQMLNQRAAASDSRDPFALSAQSTGVISTTSHALIIPSPPDPLSGPIMTLDQTGEVLMTGQIVLPPSLGVTGADTGRMDTPEVDIVDYGTEIAPSQDLAPVRASAAVSATVTRGGAVTSPIKSRDRIPLALSITATILAVAVVGLFVTGYILGVF